jgi:hypothetical protein
MRRAIPDDLSIPDAPRAKFVFLLRMKIREVAEIHTERDICSAVLMRIAKIEIGAFAILPVEIGI